MPRFLERDEAEREAPCDAVPVGRRQERQAVLEVRDEGRRRRVLMIHLPILRHGVPYRSVDVATVVHHRTRQPFVAGQPGQHGADPPRPAATGRRRAPSWPAIPARDLIAMAARGRRAVHDGDAAARSRSTASRSRRRTTSSSCRRRRGCRMCWCAGTCARSTACCRRWATSLPGLRAAWTSRCSTPASANPTVTCSASTRAGTRWASCCRTTRPACIRCGRRPSA